MVRKKRKICYLTGTRADFGPMSAVLRAIDSSNALTLSLIATGMHLMPQFGGTIAEVKKLFSTTITLDTTVKNDSRGAMAEYLAGVFPRLVTILKKEKPDMTLTLGDRGEMLVMATASLYLSIPTAHIHGGEVSSTIDEITRHAITKLSHMHFPATRESAERLVKLGEERSRIHIVGAPALDTILSTKLPTKTYLYSKLKIPLQEKFILLTLHPEQNAREAALQMCESIKAVKRFTMPVIIIYPNADSGGRSMINVIDREKHNSQFRIFPSLPYEEFLALERDAAVWVGNSSGALIESSSFNTPVVNVGKRQYNRQRSENVLDVPHSASKIEHAIQRSISQKNIKRIASFKNPWGDGKAAKRIVRVCKETALNDVLLNKHITY